jgi:hypothetical protein
MMAVFSCNGCGDDELVIIELGYCPSCALERDLITGDEYDEWMEEE